MEFEGLGALLAKQGAKHIVATLWQVADASSPSFMVEFYRQLTSNHGLGDVPFAVER